MNNRLLEIQNILFNQMKRFDDNKMSIEELNTEISRSNALSNSAMTFIKSVNLNIRIKEIANKYEMTSEKINKELGL